MNQLTIDPLEDRLNKSAQIRESFPALLPGEQFDLVMELFQILDFFAQVDLLGQLQELHETDDDDDDDDEMPY